MAIRPALVAALAAAAAAAGAPGARAQSSTVVPQPPVTVSLVVRAMRDLKFGSVLRGIPTSVATTDPRSAGEFDIQGTPGGTVRLELLLPSALERPGVASMPIGFAPGDGSYDASPGAVTRTFFDPHLPVVTQLGPRGKLIVWLGGTVTPDLFQVKGIYVATVSLTVFNLGT